MVRQRFQTQDYESPKKFIALVKRYTDFTEITAPMLNEFIEKVIVHEATGGRAHRKQKVDIHFNFIGNFVPPKQEPEPHALTAEQQEAERKSENISNWKLYGAFVAIFSICRYD